MEIIGVILAGGKSSRMGKDKSLLEIDGELLIKQTVAIFRQFFGKLIIVSNAESKFGLDDIVEISDIHTDLGPMGGIHTALTHTDGEKIFISACDTPQLSAELMALIIREAGDYEAVVPMIGGRPEPLFGIYKKSILPIVEEQIALGNVKINNLLKRLNVRYILEDEIKAVCNIDEVFFNMNTPEDFEKYKKSRFKNDALSVEAGLALLEKFIIKTPDEDVELFKTAKRTLASDCVANIDYPPFARSKVDGFAFKAEKFNLGDKFKVQKTLVAGLCDVDIDADVIAIMTGARVPNGFKTIIMQEDVEITNDEIELTNILPSEKWILPIGADFKAGEVLITAGEVVDEKNIGKVAKSNISSLSCRQKPKISLINTGDELKNLGEELEAGLVINSSALSLSFAIDRVGGELVESKIIVDDLEELCQELEYALNVSDIIITTGGTGRGCHDFSRPAINALNGEIVIDGIDIKCGKNFVVGKVGEKLIFSLSGNPNAALRCFNLMVEPIIIKMLGR